MYNKITNPLTSRKVNVTSTLGKKILKSYLLAINNRGGSQQFLPDIGWKKVEEEEEEEEKPISLYLQETINFQSEIGNSISIEEAKNMSIQDLILNVSHFSRRGRPVDISKFLQTEEKLGEQLEKNDWNVRECIDKYEENPYYPYPPFDWENWGNNPREAIENITSDLLGNVEHFYKLPPPGILRFNQTEEKIREQLAKNNWDMNMLADIYYENPWYPDTEPVIPF